MTIKQHGGVFGRNPTVNNLTVNGNITVTGTVDGRDVATDGTKLDGIEAGADVTDTTNVTAAGALMDSELTNITAVKALDQGVATTDSPSFAGLTASGNIVISTSGAGVDFSATSGTGTSELFDDYEEGTFTPTASSSSGTITSYTVNGAAYTKVGRMVFVNVDITITDAGTGSVAFDVTLPFTNGSFLCNGTGRENALTGYQLQTRVNPSSSTMSIQDYANASVIATNAQIKAMIVYFV